MTVKYYEADANYGWPNVQGFCDNISVDYSSRILDNNNMTESNIAMGLILPSLYGTTTIAPSDIIWYNHPAIEFQNSLLMTVLKNKTSSFKFSDDGQTIEEDDFFVNTWED